MKKPFKARAKIVRASFLTGMPLALVLAWPLPSFARTTMASGIDSGKTPQGAKFMSGGVGREERQQMLKMAPGYDLDLSFANRRGNYLSDVNVTISDEHGKEVLSTVTAGPWLYVALPAGKYDVRASYGNRTEEIKNVEVSKGHMMTRLLHWDTADQQVSQR
ncbi:MAG: carboxypeptidase-like regulatory domain-containing protein [Chloroflexota bacterium]